MKKITLLAAIVCLCMSVFAQKDIRSIKYEGALPLFITQSEYDLLLRESPMKLFNYYYEATQFCYIDNKVPVNTRLMGDLCEYISDGNVCDAADELVSSKQIYHSKYRMEYDELRYSAYAIGTTGYYVIVYPHNVYEDRYQAMRKEYGL
ncbi:MAG: hypothetical protein J6X65_07775 [Bacteroidales bacterium]|nr:hypothetical protein [Bacteroidales bacterium]